MINYDLLPQHIRESTKLYLEHGVIPGGFLQAVICNKLKEAYMKADDINIARMFDIVKFFYNEAPSPAWGSEENMKQWSSLKKRG